jgi:glycosyltransferase involved in cell wall biosynthesis
MIDSKKPDYQNTPVSSERPQYGYSPANPLDLPWVTIVTPFFNSRATFHETAQSVFQQSLQQWEWIIVNDGSTNLESLQMLNEYRRKDSRIRVIDHNANRGLSAARNTGFREARSDCVVQIDDDDLLEPTAVEKWSWFLESYPEFSFAKGYTVHFGDHEYLWDRGFSETAGFLEANLVNPTCAVRKAIHQAVGGYDEYDRGGLSDWDFWLRCANFGYWGGTVPEYLDWYRRRRMHCDRWPDFDMGERQRAYGEKLRSKYLRLSKGSFPIIKPRSYPSCDPVLDELPWTNVLRKENPRVLMIIPWLAWGGADKFNLDLLQQLGKRGWEVTIATTLNSDDSWLPQFARYTPDIFILNHFLRLADYPRFLRYLIKSRQADVVLVSHSELAYQLLPYFRAHLPKVTFVDFCHIEEQWKNGGYPRMAVQYQEYLDANIVSSEHLKRWMVEQGAESDRIHVCYTNVDLAVWRPSGAKRNLVRRDLTLDENLPVILYAGRICPQKQPQLFAATILRLHELGLTFTVLVAGDGPDLEWLRSFVGKYKLRHRIWLLGPVSSERMQQLFAAADIFFLPSEHEGISLSIYEAMASELAVVSADVGGQRELVTPDCGVLVERSDEPAETSQYAKVLADLLLDPRRRAEMGEAGRRRVSAHFRLESMGERMLNILDHAVRLSGTRLSPIPSLAVGRACASQTVEYFRMVQFTEQLWSERNGSRPIWNMLNRAEWRVTTYSLLRLLYGPLYRRGVKRGRAWYFPMAEKLKGALLRAR